MVAVVVLNPLAHIAVVVQLCYHTIHYSIYPLPFADATYINTAQAQSSQVKSATCPAQHQQ